MKGYGTRLFASVVRTCRRQDRQVKIVDTTGAKLSGLDLLTRALVLRRLLRRLFLRSDERRVGILLPPSAGAVVANLALALDRRVMINLNYTLTPEILNGCVGRAGISHILTSRRFLERVPLQLDAEYIYLEDLRDKPTLGEKVISAVQSHLLPERLLLRSLGLDDLADDDVMTIIFTSGTTGRPKGVELTYANIGSNLESIEHVVHWRSDDVLIGVLPFFHSFGSTVTLWCPLTREIKAAYHSNPLEAKAVGRLTREQLGTVLIATPLFLRTYLRRGEPSDFASLDVVAAGGEALPRELAEEVERTWSVVPIEGYGATEMSPVVAANLPAARAIGDAATWRREGTVGRPVPGVRTKVVDLETGRELGAGERGMLLLTGRNLMKGYLDDPAATAAAIRDGWYVTGDVAVVDGDGFITLLDRESRFAKIGGEMVPHAAVEAALTELVGTDEAGGPRVVVTSIPDPERGERLVVVHTPLSTPPAELRQKLAEAGLPNLFLPSRDSFVEVDHLPVIGAGKLDLKSIKQMAIDRLASATRRQ